MSTRSIADEMSDMFDVDPSQTLDRADGPDYASERKSRPEASTFEDKCGDLQATMESEPDKPHEESLIQAGIQTGSKMEAQIEDRQPEQNDDDDDLTDVQTVQRVDEDMERMEAEIAAVSSDTETKPEPQPQDENTAEPEKAPETKDAFDDGGEDAIASSSEDGENPLGVAGSNLRAYHEIKEKYPQFVLYNGSPQFKNFYVYKLGTLKNILSRFPVLDLAEMRSELRDINVDHYVSGNVLGEDLISEKIDDAYSQKARLGSLISEVLQQFYFWKRELHLITCKLFKDHYLRGEEKREGLIIEHLNDLEYYVREMEGFLYAARHIDGILQSALDSLSRQLTCLQMKHPNGVRLEGQAPRRPNMHGLVDETDSGVSSGETSADSGEKKDLFG